jgi:hypothetical protein
MGPILQPLRLSSQLSKPWFIQASQYSTPAAPRLPKAQAGGALAGIKILDLTRALAVILLPLLDSARVK